MTDQAGTATETPTGTAIIIYVYKMQAGSKGKRRQGQQMRGEGVWGQPAAGIGSLAALHVVVFVVDQCAACSAASDIKMLGLLRPEPSRAEPNRTKLPSNRDQLCNRIRQQFRGQTASGDAATDSFWMLYAGHGPAWSTSSGRGRGGLRLLQASSASAASTRVRSTFNKQF